MYKYALVRCLNTQFTESAASCYDGKNLSFSFHGKLYIKIAIKVELNDHCGEKQSKKKTGLTRAIWKKAKSTHRSL